MIAMDAIALAQECAPGVHPVTMAAVMRVESANNPYAIGVVGGHLVRQPRNKEEAIATAKALEAAGWNFSIGSGQVNRYNLQSYGLTYETAFEPCSNIRAGSKILRDCYTRALSKFGDEQQALKAAFSCYYSGNFKTGFTQDFKGQPSYVNKVLASANEVSKAIPVKATAISVTPKATPAKANPAPTPTALPAPSTQNETPVLMQPAPGSKKKVKGVPAKYDGFGTHEDETDNYDGYQG